MEDAGNLNGSNEGSRGDHSSANSFGVTLSAVGMLIGLLIWPTLLPIMTMGAANCSDSSTEPICNPTLMSALSFVSLAGMIAGLVITLAIGPWKVHKKKSVKSTLIFAWAITILPTLIFLGAGWNAA